MRDPPPNESIRGGLLAVGARCDWRSGSSRRFVRAMSVGQTPEAPLLSSASASNTVTGWCVVVGEIQVYKALSRRLDITIDMSVGTAVRQFSGWRSGWQPVQSCVGTVQQSPRPASSAARDSMRSA